MIGDRWGVGESEVLRAYPCDDFVASPVLQAWRGIRIAVPAGAVWPWVAQIRLAPYSYDWIDNRGRRSSRELAGLREPRAGERFTTAGGRALGRIVLVDPGKQLTATIMGAFVSYVLVPQDDGATRLLLKVTHHRGARALRRDRARWSGGWEVRRHVHVRGPSVETELVALDVLHHDARLVVVIGRQ